MGKKEYIEELIRKVTSIVSPGLYDETLNVIMNKETRKRLYDDHPKCFIPMTYGDKNPLLLPICNRQGLEDLKMIRFSMKLMDRMKKHFNDIDQDNIDSIIIKLKRLESKFLKEIPKSTRMAALKAKSTININNNIKSYLQKIRNS